MSKILESGGFTRSEVAFILNRSKSTVRNLESRGILYSELQGQKYVIDTDSLYAYIESHEQELVDFYLRRADTIILARNIRKMRKEDNFYGIFSKE